MRTAKRACASAHHSVVRLSAVLVLLAPLAANATLVMEPVFDFFPGSGPDDNVVGLYAPDFINPATGEPFLLSNHPGVVSIFPAGFPADPGLVDTVRFYNNTSFILTGFTLNIVGTADEPEPFDFTVTRDPNVDAMWGDANDDGAIGLSDIFATVQVSPDGRTIVFKDGEIPVNGRFTDYIFSMTTDGEPFNAAVEAHFEGVFIPIPPAAWLFGTALGLLGWLRRRVT